MQTILAGITTGAALLGLVYAWVARRATKQQSGWTLLTHAGWNTAPLLGGGIALLAFLFTLPYRPPFSPGLLLGWGIAIGALCGLLAVGEAAADAAGEAWASRCAALLSLAALGPSLILILFRGDPSDALIGCAFGGVTVGFGCLAVMAPIRAASDDGPADAFGRGLEAYILSSSAVAAGAWLAIQQHPRPAPFAGAGGYWAVPGLLTGVAALVLLFLSSGRGERTPPGRLLTIGVVASFVAALAAAVLRARLLPLLPWTACAFAAAGAAITGMLFINVEHADDDRPLLPALVSVGIALLVAALAWQAGGAYGQALALAAVAVVAMVLYGGRTSARAELARAMVAGATALLLLLSWYRIFSGGLPRWRTLDFQQNYQFLAVALGAAAVFAVLSLVTTGAADIRRRGFVARPHVGRAIGLGLAAVAAPLFVAALWGERAVAAYLGGLVVAEVVWMLLAAWTVGDERRETLIAAPHVYLLGSALVAARITPLVIAFELTRAQKVGVIGALAVIVAVCYLAARVRGLSDEKPA